MFNGEVVQGWEGGRGGGSAAHRWMGLARSEDSAQHLARCVLFGEGVKLDGVHVGQGHGRGPSKPFWYKSYGPSMVVAVNDTVLSDPSAEVPPQRKLRGNKLQNYFTKSKMTTPFTT